MFDSENDAIKKVAEALGGKANWTNGMEDIDDEAARQGQAVSRSKGFQPTKPNKPHNANNRRR